jgi:hypothetical protein
MFVSFAHCHCFYTCLNPLSRPVIQTLCEVNDRTQYSQCYEYDMSIDYLYTDRAIRGAAPRVRRLHALKVPKMHRHATNAKI